MPSTSGGEGENQVEGEAPTAEHPAAAEHRHKRRRVLVASLLALATVIGVFAVFAVWANRQVLNSENWTNTSSQLLAAPKVQAVLGDFLANEAFEAVPVEQELEHALPAKVRGLAGPATAGLRSLASQYMPQFLATSAVQEAWREATTVVHDELIKLLEGGGPALSTTKGEVVLHLKPLVEQLAGQLGLSHQLHELQSKLNSSTGEVAKSKAEEKLKEHGITVPKNGEIVLMRSNQLAAAQDLFEGIKGLSVVLPILAILLFAAAVALAVGWRRVALRSAGWCVFALGLIAILVRKVGGEQVVNDLVREPNRPAMTEVWQISTTELYDIAIALITYGLVIVIAAWLAGPTRPATALRRAMTPTLRDHPGRAYGIGGVILLLAVIWGPFPSLREFWPIVGIAVLIALGIYTLRRASEREFPDAHAGETIAALRERYSRARHGSR
ncbi:MAG TPA: hypothetical protein VMA83_09640 [Solirubrobacteraceae bacterium]|nr:hypothetical protein [Solirubrobacteraceae bacterium]